VPLVKAWQKLRLETVNLDELFPRGETLNVGLLLGTPSNGLIDIDLDSPEAAAAGRILLPATNLVSGRPSRPCTHFWFVTPDPPRPEKHTDLDRGCLAELRSTNQQTLAPPSSHPSGEPVLWYSFGRPACVQADELQRAVREVASAALLARHWPAQGERDNAALALTGALVRAGWGEEKVGRYVFAVAAGAKDEEARKRASKAAAAYARLAGGANVWGWPTLENLLGERGEEVVARVRDWLDLTTSTALGGQAAPAPSRNGKPADDLAYRPFPLEALPPPIRGFVDAGARAIGCDPAYVALPLLVALAAAIGNTRRLVLKRGWLALPILWGAIVGESGTAKSPAFRLAMRPVRERQRKALERHQAMMRRYLDDLARWSRDMTIWKRKRSDEPPPAQPEEPRAERFIVSDVTIEALVPILQANPRGLLLARDELAGWIGSFDRYVNKSRTSSDSANWLSMFNAEDVVVDRKTGFPRTIHVPRAAVCIVGGIQPAILQRALGREHRESGLAARLLLAFPPRKVKRWTEADIDPSAEDELAKLFDRLYELQPATGDDGEPRPVLVRLSSDAKAAWEAYYNAHAAEQADLAGDMASAWSKLEEYAARLALVVHCVRWAAGAVADETRLDVDSMTAGISLAQWFKHEARRAYSMLDETDDERDLRRLADWVAHRGGTATPREVQMGCRWLREAGAAKAALEELVKAGRGSWRDVPAAEKDGRPTRAFVLFGPSAPPATNGCKTPSDGGRPDSKDNGLLGHLANPPRKDDSGQAEPAGPGSDEEAEWTE
jgi:hypothetical protein